MPQRPLPYVTPKLPARPLNALDGPVRPGNCFGDAGRIGGDAEDTAAAGYKVTVALVRAGVEDLRLMLTRRRFQFR